MQRCEGIGGSKMVNPPRKALHLGPLHPLKTRMRRCVQQKKKKSCDGVSFSALLLCGMCGLLASRVFGFCYRSFKGYLSLILGPALFLGLQIGLEDLVDAEVFCTEYGVELNVFAREIAKIAESHVHVPRSRAVGLSGRLQIAMLLTRYFSTNTINMTLAGVEIV